MVTATLLQSSGASPLFADFGFGPSSLVILGIIAVLLFGERLPEVARSVGKWFMEIKTQVHGFEREIRSAIDSTDSPPSHSASSSASSVEYESPEDREEATAPKFEPPPPT